MNQVTDAVLFPFTHFQGCYLHTFISGAQHPSSVSPVLRHVLCAPSVLLVSFSHHSGLVLRVPFVLSPFLRQVSEFLRKEKEASTQEEEFRVSLPLSCPQGARQPCPYSVEVLERGRGGYFSLNSLLRRSYSPQGCSRSYKESYGRAVTQQSGLQKIFLFTTNAKRNFAFCCSQKIQCGEDNTSYERIRGMLIYPFRPPHNV